MKFNLWGIWVWKAADFKTTHSHLESVCFVSCKRSKMPSLGDLLSYKITTDIYISLQSKFDTKAIPLAD